MKNTFLLFSILISVQGCTSIDQPVASRALVEQQLITQDSSVDSTLSTALSNLKSGAVFSIQNRDVVIGSKFFAATGLTCRKVSSVQNGEDIYCYSSIGNWFKVNKIISIYNESTL